MATFFPGTSEIQADGLQTLYLMNPGYVGYPETGGSGNMVFLNHPTGNSINPANLSPTPQQQSHHFIGIPLPATPQEPKRQPLSIQQEEPTNGFLPSRHHYNLWRNSGNEFTFLQAIDPENHHQISPQMNNSVNLATTVVQPVAREMSNQLGLKQGLSLTLSSQSQQQQPSSVQFGNFQTESLKQGSAETGELRIASSLRQGDVNCSVSNGTNGLQSIFTSSKYLRAAQQLLDEVVNVGKGIKQVESESPIKTQIKNNKETVGGGDVSGAESSGKRGSELTTVERQELQMKKAKLVGMLEEVDQRYRQYHHQMQIVISSFEAAAGFGSAKTYTALALQTISKQFRCLRDAISGQIRATSKSLGDEDCLGGGRVEGSKLRFVDHHLRQQRALQQLGMIQHNAWRPQRGLPERSVSVLRAWLFEHFLHPYPKDADKIMLAKQTGLTRSQVSNWFINARVRLWKPMVEEMYNEETKEQEEANASDEKTSKSEINEESRLKTNPENSPTRKEQIENSNLKHDHSSDLKSPPHPLAPSASSIPVSTIGNVRTQTGFSLIGSDQQTSFQDRESIRQGNPKKAKNGLQDFNSLSSINVDLKPEHANRDDFCSKFGEDRQNTDGYSLITGPTDHSGRFGAYQIEEMGRFNLENYAPRFSGNGVSLTLGLPHCENLSLSGTQQHFLSNQHLPMGRRFEISSESSDFCNINTPTSAATAFENINTQTRKRFAAQLLRDFVA